MRESIAATNWRVALFWALGIVVSINQAVIIWICLTLIGHGEKIATCVTRDDIKVEARTVADRLMELQRQIDKNDGPAWLVDRMNKLESRMDVHRELILSMKADVQRAFEDKSRN